MTADGVVFCSKCGEPSGVPVDGPFVCPGCGAVPENLPHVRLFSQNEALLLAKQAFAEGHYRASRKYDPKLVDEEWAASDVSRLFK